MSCACPSCRTSQTLNDLKAALSDLEEVSTHYEGNFYYLRDAIKEALDGPPWKTRAHLRGVLASFRRIDSVRYIAGTHVLVVRMNSGQSFTLPMSKLSVDDHTGVTRCSVSKDGSYLRVQQGSGNVFHVPWDLVLQHCDPTSHENYYKASANPEPEIESEMNVSEWEEPVQQQRTGRLGSVVSVRFSPDEVATIRQAAGGCALSTFIRETVLRAVVRQRRSSLQRGEGSESD